MVAVSKPEPRPFRTPDPDRYAVLIMRRMYGKVGGLPTGMQSEAVIVRGGGDSTDSGGLSIFRPIHCTCVPTNPRKETKPAWPS